MKKNFEIIEQGRALCSDSMNKVHGGSGCVFNKYTTCTPQYKVTLCAKEYSVYCGPNSAYNYKSCSAFDKDSCSGYCLMHSIPCAYEE